VLEVFYSSVHRSELTGPRTITCRSGRERLLVCAEYPGHDNIESTKLYTRVSVEKLRATHPAEQ